MTYPNLLDRFLTYVKVNTRSDEHSTTTLLLLQVHRVRLTSQQMS